MAGRVWWGQWRSQEANHDLFAHVVPSQGDDHPHTSHLLSPASFPQVKHLHGDRAPQQMRVGHIVSFEMLVSYCFLHSFFEAPFINGLTGTRLCDTPKCNLHGRSAIIKVEKGKGTRAVVRSGCKIFLRAIVDVPLVISKICHYHMPEIFEVGVRQGRDVPG